MRRLTSKYAALLGGSFCAALCALPGSVLAQVSTINSATIDPRVFDDVPSATLTTVNNYPSAISFTEQNVSGSGFANRDVWYFSNNGGASAYEPGFADYFQASFGLKVTGGDPGLDIEAGFLLSDPSGEIGGDLQSLVTGAGVVVQFGGPSYYPFSPAAGGYPGAGGSVPNYVEGQTYNMLLDYTVDPNTHVNAFEYAVNGQYAASSAGDPYFDLGPGVGLGNVGDALGGYFQIQQNPNDPTNTGEAVFSNINIVPEPTTLALLGVGVPLLLRRRRA
jgi:hypothetical protein